MHCPQCGQQQASDQLRFCSRCGFPLDGVIQLLGNGGILPTSFVDKKGRNISPRSLGIRHGAMLMLLTLLVVPIVSILAVNFTHSARILIPLSAMICLIGGLLRVIYALLFEEDVQRVKPHPTLSQHVPPIVSSLSGATATHGAAALPPQQSTPVSNWRPRADTAELVRPPSVTENTTRLLDDKIDPNAR
ncbi:MAG: hypothetical protein QOD00_3749 [Blastocatellia bacterium]|jgi:hypothetical protein|nr:hypothetical protein [Blastocatellia bacterium]